MAARENQGLQISLIIFVMLTIILSVTTFIFYNNYKEQFATADRAKKDASEAGNRERTLQEERNNLAMKLGFPATEKKEDIEAKTGAEIKKYADFFQLQMPADQQHYSRLVEELAKTVEAKNKELVTSKEAYDTLNKQLKDAQVKWDADVKLHEADKEKAVQSEKASRDAFTSQVAELNTTKAQAAGIITQKEQTYGEKLAAAENQIKKLREDVGKAQATIEHQKEIIEGLTQANPTVPDGRISWVNQRDNTVFINLGSDDGLQRRISFSVYDRNATDAAKAVKKGSIEVLSIRGPHLAEARIIESTNSDPIVSGDIIYTPIWQPGQTQHFALAGFIDFDNDGVSDRAKLKDIISYNGGVIDAEMDDKGKITGQMSHRTNSLIIGQPPSDTQEDQLKAFTALGREAAANGVPTIKVDGFLAQIGYSVRTATSNTANTSGPRSLRPSGDAPDSTKTSGEGFRTRRPPAKNGGSPF